MLKQVTASVPCGPCKQHWREVLANHPPIHGLGWFDWTVTVHNAVNRKLGKPVVSAAEARRIWGVHVASASRAGGS